MPSPVEREEEAATRLVAQSITLRSSSKDAEEESAMGSGGRPRSGYVPARSSAGTTGLAWSGDVTSTARSTTGGTATSRRALEGR
eukprot:5239522-Pleurochrysis_carterae.AAC.1